MIKKYYLPLTFIILNFCSINIKGINYRNFIIAAQDDAVYLCSEIANIATWDSTNSLKIKASSVISLLKNSIWSWFKIDTGIDTLEEGNKKKDKKLCLYSLLSIFSGLQLCPCIGLDARLFKHSSKVAMANKNSKIITPNLKTKQALWLIGNCLIPYATLAIKRLAYDKAPLNNALFHNITDQEKNSNRSYQLFMISRFLRDISESLRKFKFYKKIIDTLQAHNLENTHEKNIVT